MPPLSDPEELLAIADRIAGHAGAARERADRLARAEAAVTWHGAAAGAFRQSCDGVVAGLRSSAARLEDAAGRLRAHAQRVAAVLADLRRVVDDLDAVGAAALHAARDSVLGDTVRLLGW